MRIAILVLILTACGDSPALTAAFERQCRWQIEYKRRCFGDEPFYGDKQVEICTETHSNEFVGTDECMQKFETYSLCLEASGDSCQPDCEFEWSSCFHGG